MNENGGRQQTIRNIKKLLWNALERSNKISSKVQALNHFKIDDSTFACLGDRPVIFNNQIISTDIRLHQDIHEAIMKLDNLEIGAMANDIKIEKFIEAAFNVGMTLPDLMNKVEDAYLEYSLGQCESQAAAARRIGINRTTLVEKCKRKQIGKENNTGDCIEAVHKEIA